jgi:polyisoprenoid-binding protein YceI
MRIIPLAAIASLGLLASASLVAQSTPPAIPGAMDAKRVTAGTYAVDGGHTQVLFSYNHMGFTNNMGIIAEPTGSMTLDPKMPNSAKVSISFPVTNMRTGIPALDAHLMKPEFFDAAKFPTATFESTSVKAKGTSAKIMGNLTIHGVTKPVTLDAHFTGAGMNTFMKKETVGFSAATTIKRSEFGMGYGVPMVGDTIDLKITAAFEK